ncbi:hypothetical protein GQ649_26075 [Rhodococcus sp. DSM 6344]|nr:hypothetical protein [Rhodococcus erythropolis]
MGLYNRGRAVTGMYLDGKPVIRAYLGDRLVWDGSRSAFVSVPRIAVVMSASTPDVSASSSVAVGVAAMAMSAGAPSVTATALVAIPAAAMTLVVPAPIVHADANVSVEVVTIAMQALPAVGAVGADSTVAVPTAAVTMSAPAPTVAAHFEAAIPVVAVTMSTPAPVVTATGSAVVAVGVAEMMVAAKAPVVTASSSVSVLVATMGMSAKAPVVTASSTVAVPAVAVTMAAKNPVVQAINFSPSGMTKNGNWEPGTTYPWITVPAWTADAGSTVVTDGVRARGTKSNAVVSTQLRIRNTASGGNECAVRLLLAGVVVKTGSLITFTAGQTQTLTLASDPTPVVTDQIATVQIQGPYGRIEVQSGADTWVRIT